MLKLVGHIEALFRYPVKSMAGESLDSASVGWHGVEGDRRLALRRITESGGGFPWLSAGRLPELVLFAPQRAAEGALRTHVRTPDGVDLPMFSDELAAEIERRHGVPVQMTHLKHGIFDEGSVSVIVSDTVDEICRMAGVPPDVRRFRPNILIRPLASGAFQEDAWVGGVLRIGEGDGAPEISVTLRDERCAMLNLDPDTAQPQTEMMKAVVRANQNHAGVYGAVTRTGTVRLGEPVFYRSSAK